MEITGNSQPEQAKSAEYQTFEKIVKKAFSMTKEELDERIAKEKKVKQESKSK